MFAGLCLLFLWSLVEVHSQNEFPYVSFMGENLPNHSYVDLTLVGDPTVNDGDHSVQCHTDLSSCCSGGQGLHRGDWYFPDGTTLPFAREGGIHEAREAQRVDIRRDNNANSPSGIYRCDIPTDAVHDETDTSVRETVYVGVYATGGTTGLISMIVNAIFLTGDVIISGDVTLTVDSDLNGPSPQFTLTCISTGGPATTVTWTRDSETAVGTQRSAVVDGETAQYTHTLTVTGRLPGVYTCTVANNKPSVDSNNFTVKGACVVIHKSFACVL